MKNPLLDTNSGNGWTVLTQWFKLEDGSAFHPTLKEARRDGLQLACLKGVKSVRVVRSDNKEVVASYNKSDNEWRDHLEEVREWEKKITDIDMIANFLRHNQTLTLREELQVLDAVTIGGIVAHDMHHHGCDLLQKKGLLTTDSKKWSLTEAGKRYLLYSGS